jgi:hypothetical protein
MTSTRDLLLAVQSGKSTVIQATFDAVITEKTTAAIEAYREAVIDNTFNTVHESEEDQSIEKAVKRLANGTKLSEEISELSKKTLRSYIKNAKSDIRAKNKIVKSVEKLGPDRATAYDFHNMQNAEYKVLDRKDGVSKATHRLTKESEDFDLSEFTLEEIQEFMESEDFSTLDELSKKTLASYVKKSSSNAADLATNAMHLKNIANTHD